MTLAAESPSSTEAPKMPRQPEPDVIETFEERSERYRQGLKDATGRQTQTIKQFLLEKLLELKGRHAEAHRLHLRNMDQCARYLAGEQYGSYNADGTYEPYGRLPGDVAYCVPVIVGHFGQGLMMLLKTQPGYSCEAKDKNSSAYGAVARMCEALANEDAERMMDEDARIDESTNCLTAGESHRCLIWGVHDNPKTITKPIYADEDFELPGTQICNSCGFPNLESATACELCGSDYLSHSPGEKKKRKQFKGTKEVYVGQNILHIPHMTAVKSDLSASNLRDASFILETDYLASKTIAEWLYQCPIDEGSITSEAVRLQRSQQGGVVQVAPAGSWGDRSGREIGYSGNSEPPVERNHVWLEPAEYGHKVFEEDQQLPNGEKIKKDIPMGDQFPMGFKFCVVGETVVIADKGYKKIQWSRVLHGKRPGSNRGVGIQMAIVLNDIVNDVFNLDYTTLMTSMPFRAAVRQFVNKMPGAGEVLFLNKMPVGGINNAVAQFPAQAPGGAGAAIIERVQESSTFILGTNSLMGVPGAPDQKAMGTATGVAASVENNNGRSLPFITQRIGADKHFRFQILQNIQQHSSDEQRQELVARFGEDTVTDFFQANLEHVVKWVVTPGTDKPRSDALTQAVLMEFGTMAANMMKAMPNVPWVLEFLTTLADMLGVPFKMAPGGNDRREAERRLKKLAAIERTMLQRNPAAMADEKKASQDMFQLLEEFVGPLSMQSAIAASQEHGDEDGISGLIPFLYMQEHTTFQDAYKDELFSEEANTFSPARRNVIAYLFSLHVEAYAAAEELKATLQSGLAQKLGASESKPTQPSGAQKIIETMAYKDAPPDIQRQMEAQAGFTPSQADASGDEANAEEAAKAREDENAAREHQLSETAKDADLQRKLVEQGHKAETTIAIEQAKAAVKPQPTSGPAKAKK